MKFGASIAFTDYSMGPAALARALEERGLESLWAPEHSHIPTSRRSPFPAGGDLPSTGPEEILLLLDHCAELAATVGQDRALSVVLVMARAPEAEVAH